MFKNTAAKFLVFAWDTTTGLAKTGDAANITAYVSKDYGTVTVLADTSATELDSTNAKGYYVFDAAQGETNGDILLVTAKSATANIAVIGAPAIIFTRPQTGWLAPATAGRTLVVDAAGLADANMVKMGPTGAGSAQTARDIGASVLLSSGTGTGQVKLSSGYVAPNWGDVGNPTTVVGLTGTTVKTATDVETDTQDIQSRLPAALVSGRIDASVGAMTTGVITATAIAADAITAAKIADGAIDAATFAAGAITASAIAADAITDAKVAGDVTIASVTGAVGSVTGNVGGNVVGSVSSVVGAVGSVTATINADVKKVNGVTITGDGSATPFNV